MRFYLRTLGCKMNQLDSARMAAVLAAAGHELARDEDSADVVLVNTCTVTAESDRKSRQAARAAGRRTPEVAVVGCGPRADGERWRDALPDARVFPSVEAALRHYGGDPEATPFPLTARTRLPVAVQTGCDDTCAFCITRLARGPHRSHPAGAVLEQVRAARERGVAEVVLTGINLAAWGAGDTRRPGEARLHALLEALLAGTDVPRIRLGSLGPQYLHPAFFDVYADPRVCDYLHLSVQSGSPGVLARMERGHDAATVARVAERARAVRPDTALTADLIAGFPGESEAEHAETLALAEAAGLARLHVFPFSPREGTPAATLPGQVDGDTRRRRAAELRALGRRLRADFIRAQMGRAHPVLVESGEAGYTPNHLRLRCPGGREGEVRPVTVAPETLAEPGRD